RGGRGGSGHRVETVDEAVAVGVAVGGRQRRLEQPHSRGPPRSDLAIGSDEVGCHQRVILVGFIRMGSMHCMNALARRRDKSRTRLLKGVAVASRRRCDSSRILDTTFGVLMTVSMREMLEAGVHFGHQTRFWNPKMAPYI